MLKNWYYSLLMWASYVSLFLYWKYFPSRTTFVVAGIIVIAWLAVGLRRAHRAGYFVNRIDLFLHAYVILDLCLETASFEAFRLVQPFAVVGLFHDNNNFIGCTLAFTLLLGGYRWVALRRQKVPVLDGATCGQASI